MRFKTVRLTAIRNELKRIISTSDELMRLQMVSEADIEQCVSKDARPTGGGLLDPTFL